MGRFRTSSRRLGWSSVRSDAGVVPRQHLLLQEPACLPACPSVCLPGRLSGRGCAGRGQPHQPAPAAACCPLSLQHPLPALPAHDSSPTPPPQGTPKAAPRLWGSGEGLGGGVCPSQGGRLGASIGFISIGKGRHELGKASEGT